MAARIRLTRVTHARPWGGIPGQRSHYHPRDDSAHPSVGLRVFEELLPTHVLHMSHTEPETTTFVRFVDDVRRYVRRRVDDPSVQDDLVQEVFLRVHDRREQLRDDERLAGWVRRIASNVVTDHYRRRPATAARSEALPEQLAAPSDEDEGERTLLAAWIAITVEQLDPPYRDVLTLTELQGLTQREAAARLGLSLPAVKARVLRGRAELRRRLERCCHVELDHRGALVGYSPRSPCTPARCCPTGDDG